MSRSATPPASTSKQKQTTHAVKGGVQATSLRIERMIIEMLQRGLEGCAFVHHICEMFIHSEVCKVYTCHRHEENVDRYWKELFRT